MPTFPASEARDADLAEPLAAQVASATGPLRIVGGATRGDYGRRAEGAVLSLAGHRGVTAYDPSELVLTARTGTPVAEIEALLALNNQMLAFEPPLLRPGSTLGGMVAIGLSGPRRPFAGALRDFVLGAKVLDGRGEVLNFGGTVFKNVAGFDAFRLMAGALGGLGVILEVSLRVAPRPRAETTLAFDLPGERARGFCTKLMRRPLPLSGAFHDGERLHLRLSGGEAAVREAAAELGGEAERRPPWAQVAALTHPVFDGPDLWRVSLPAGVALMDAVAWDWGGAQAWIAGEAPDTFARAAALGGHATRLRGGDRRHVFQPLPAPLFDLHRRIKAAMDPAGRLNPGAMYEGL